MSLHMIRQEIDWLRAKARRVRELAVTETGLFPELRDLAIELEAEAGMLAEKLADLTRGSGALKTVPRQDALL
jgi:hypothetical protein